MPFGVTESAAEGDACGLRPHPQGTGGGGGVAVPHGRLRRYSVVDEEDEAAGSGSECSRRSQRFVLDSLVFP